jgi:hypothetical protein
LWQVGGQMDMMKLIAAFRNFANVPKNWTFKQLMSWNVDWVRNYENIQQKSGCDNVTLNKNFLFNAKYHMCTCPILKLWGTRVEIPTPLLSGMRRQ